MLTALNNTQQKHIAWETDNGQKPFYCATCKQEVTLKQGNVKVQHFAHQAPVTCTMNQSQEDMFIKRAIYEALLKEDNCSKIELEKKIDGISAALSFTRDNQDIAIEIQGAEMDIHTIKQKVQHYKKLGIYLIFIMNSPEPEPASKDIEDDNYPENLCRPKEWESYIHNLFDGRLYHWQHEAYVKPFHLDAYTYTVEAFDEDSAYDVCSKTKQQYSTPMINNQEVLLHVAKDFKATVHSDTTLWLDTAARWW